MLWPMSAPELLQAREVDEHQPVEGRRGGPHAEQHAGGRSGDGRLPDRPRPRRGRADAPTYSRTTPSTPRPNSMAAEPAAAADSRWSGKAQPAERDDERQRRGKRSHRDQPHASERDVEKRQDQRERADGVEDGLACGRRLRSRPRCGVRRRTRLVAGAAAPRPRRREPGRRDRALIARSRAGAH